MSKGMADYQLLGGPGGYGLEDSAAAAMGPYGHVTTESVGTGASSVSIPSMHSQSMGILTQQPGSQSTYQQLGVPHSYSQGEMAAKYSHYGGYSTTVGLASNQYNSGARLHHLSDSMSVATPQQSAMIGTSHMAPSYQTMANSRYSAVRAPQLAAASMHHPAQSAQYSPYTHTQSSQGVVNSSAALSDMWSTPAGHSQVATQQAYMHPSSYPPQAQQTPAQLSPHTSLSSVKSVQSQYGMAADDYVTHAGMTTLQQRKAAAMYATQPSSNGPHLATGATQQPQQQQQTLSHIPVSQPDRQQAYSSQGPYGTNSQSIVSRPHYSTSSLQHGTSSTAAGISSQAMRPMQRLPYSSLHSQVNSGQPPGMSQANRMPYCSPYPSSQPYPVVPQQAPQSLNDTSTPPHMSPYQSSQLNASAPASPQYRGGYPASTPQMAVSPRQPTSTPPAQGSPMPAASRTPDRLPNPPAAPTTPQSQGSYPSPGGARISSPGQVLSPGNTNSTPSSSLQQLEQMVMPSTVKANQLPPQHASQQPPTSNSLCSTNLMGGSYYSQQQQQSMASQQSPHMGVSHAHPYYGQSASGMAPTPQQPTVNRGNAYVPNSQNSIPSAPVPPSTIAASMETVQNSVAPPMSYGSSGPMKSLDIPSSPQMTSGGGVVGPMPPVSVVPTMSSPHHYQSNSAPSYQNGASNSSGYGPHIPYQRMQYSAPSVPEEKKVLK